MAAFGWCHVKNALLMAEQGLCSEAVVAAGLEKLAAQAGLPLSTFALQELTESARRADNAELLNSLPSVPIDRATILDALAESRAER